MALSPVCPIQIVGRLVSGAGGVMLNVQMTKMVTDWFAGKEIASAMGIFVNSWPAGIALSLITLPLIGSASGIDAVYFSVAAFIGIALAVFALLYRPPTKVTTVAATSAWPDRSAFVAVIVAGLIWGFFNAGFATVFSFGPSMLAERGWSAAAAGSVTSIVLWVAVISVPLGGFLADRSGRPNIILIAGCLIGAVAMIALPRSDSVLMTVTVYGLIIGLPAGPIMSLPARVLRPQTRSLGMGVFYTLYYGTMMLGPVLAGACARWSGSAAGAFDFGAATLLVCPILLWAYYRLPATAPNIA